MQQASDRTIATTTALFRRFRVTHKLMDALYGPVLRCIDLQQQERQHSDTSSSLQCTNSHQQSVVSLKYVSLACVRRQMIHSLHAHLDDPWQEHQVVQQLISLGGHANILRYHQVLQVLKQKQRSVDGSNNKASALVIVMEFCSRGDLLEHLTSFPDNRMPESEALALFLQVAQAVQFLHQRGIAHRDLSLENVLLTEHKVPKVCDFALSCDTWQRCQGPVGKAVYMAPEVVAGSLYKPESADIWSLGVMLFILLTGSRFCEVAEASDVGFDLVKNHGASQLVKIWGLDGILKHESLDLMDGLLQVNPSERLSVHEIVTHAALQELQPDIRPLAPSEPR